jgi:hypothetical protein
MFINEEQRELMALIMLDKSSTLGRVCFTFREGEAQYMITLFPSEGTVTLAIGARFWNGLGLSEALRLVERVHSLQIQVTKVPVVGT